MPTYGPVPISMEERRRSIMKASLIPFAANKRRLYFIALLLCVFFASILLTYISLRHKALTKAAFVSLSEISYNSAQNVKHRMNDMLTLLSAESAIVGGYSDIRSPEVIGILKKQLAGSHYSNLWVVGSDFVAFAADGSKLDVSKGLYTRRAMEGVAGISPLISPSFTDKDCILFCVPIFRKGRIVGVLSASFYNDKFYALFKSSVYGGRGDVCAVDSGGRLIASRPGIAPNPVLFCGKSPVGTVRTLCEPELLEAMKTGRRATVRTMLKGDIYYMSVAPIGLNGWYLLTSVPESVVMERFSSLTSLTLFTIGALVLLFLAFLYLVVRFFMDNTETIREELASIAMREERYEIVTKNTSEYIFEWNNESEKIYVVPSYIERFGSLNVTAKAIKTRDADLSGIHPDDLEHYIQFAKNIQSGATVRNDTEIRLKTVTGQYVWCAIHTTNLTDANGKIIRVLGSIRDIDAVVRERQKLKRAAELDGLTGVYDKDTTESEITEYLNGLGKSGRHVLFIADVDNFKSINDTYGHYMGDAVLGDIALGMRRIFRESDIVGRIGGDEFMVLIKNVDSDGLIHRKAIELRDVFVRCAVGKSADADFKISGSVGAAIYPEHGRAFDELYRKADIALYKAKASGKDTYVIYDGEICMAATCTARTETEHGATIPVGQKPFDENIERYLFNILNTSKNFAEGLDICFGMICRVLDVSRGQIFIFEQGGDAMDCMFEWCSDKKLSTQADYRHFTLPADHPIRTRFDRSDIYFLDSPKSAGNDDYAEVLRSHGIKSMVQCCFREQGKVRGYVCFDECEAENRIPTSQCIETTKTIADIIGAYIIKDAAISDLACINKMQEMLLDGITEPVYIIDWKTCELVYMNASMKKIAVHADVGIQCYRAFNGLAERCSDCPMAIMDKNGLTQYESELYLSKLKVKTCRKVLRYCQDGGRERGLFCILPMDKDPKDNSPLYPASYFRFVV